MFFKRIEIQGFKSFAEPVSIDFDEGITCIVGPNGSGKSNISDALRWVLGEQSPKMLRGGKMEEVIFAGSDSRKSRGMAQVTLVMDNAKKILPIDYSEVAITRRVYRSGDSEYFINKVPCRLKDIRELIMDTGIGVEGFSIIGQGRISDIVSSKPESRREIFEEAAGIMKYRSRKAESQRKLEGSRANLERVDDIIGEIEARIDGLREDSIKAKEYIGLRDRYKELEINVTLKNIENIELKSEYLKDELMEAESQAAESLEEKEALEQEVLKSRSRSQELEAQTASGQEKLMDAVEAVNQLEGKSRLQEERLATIEKDRRRLEEEREAAAARREKEQANRESLRGTAEAAAGELAGLKRLLEEKSREYEALEGEAASGNAAAEEARERIYRLQLEASGKRSEAASLESLRDTLEKRKAEVLEEEEASHRSGSSLRSAHEAAEEKRRTLEAALSAAEAELEEVRNTGGRCRKDIGEREERLGRLRLTLGQAGARRRVIEEMENSYEGYHYGVRFVMESGVAGLYGPVAELIRVPEGYETAIETALGGALQNIVCADDKSAREAIAALKKSRAGRLTFLPLNGLRSQERSGGQALRGEEGFRGLGVECVEFDPKYRKVMEYLLGRVVVVDHIDHAVALSKKNPGGLRFVTLEGELINAGGAITGGAAKNRATGLLERKAESQRLEAEISRMQEEQALAEKELASLREAAAVSAVRAEELERERREKELALINLDSELAGLSLRLSGEEAAGSKRRQELEKIEAEKRSSASMVEALEAEAARMEESIKAAEAEVLEASAAWESRKEALEAARGEITELRMKAASSESEKSNLERIMAQVDSYIADFNREIEGKEAALALLLRQKEETVESGRSLEEALAGKERERKAAEEFLEELSAERLQLNREREEKEQRKEEIERLLLESQMRKHELELKLAKNETQVEAYKEKLWEDFEISYLQAMEFRKKEFAMGAAQRESREIRERMKALGDVNVGAIREYETVRERHEFLTEQRRDLTEAIETLEKIIESLDRDIRRCFKETFDVIAVNFQDAFQALFGGGAAELRLEDESRLLDCGIDIIAHPPGKKMVNINLMSGGEKTLTAIALMFAILKSRPTPFCILDEVEASLDELNIERFTGYLRKYQDTQFAIITHQKATMEKADALYGITMPEQGVSRVISLRLGDDFDLD
ncbi:MAG: chromosome segregation protein SMC [Bacillota bacterium]|nr:chromosome segregation protein SMC [Bacillota bacterium]